MAVLQVSWMFFLLAGVSLGYPVQQGGLQKAYSPKGQNAYAPAIEEASEGHQSPEGQDVESQPDQEYVWLVPPPHPQGGPQKPQLTVVYPTEAPILPAPEPFVPQYQAGDLLHSKKISEHGGYDSETEEQGFLPLPPPPPAEVEPQQSSETSVPLPPDAGILVPFNYKFLTGQYPRGTYSHFSSTFEHGRDNWQDSHYLKYDYPAETVQQKAPAPPQQQVPKPQQQVSVPQQQQQVLMQQQVPVPQQQQIPVPQQVPKQPQQQFAVPLQQQPQQFAVPQKPQQQVPVPQQVPQQPQFAVPQQQQPQQQFAVPQQQFAVPQKPQQQVPVPQQVPQQQPQQQFAVPQQQFAVLQKPQQFAVPQKPQQQVPVPQQVPQQQPQQQFAVPQQVPVPQQQQPQQQFAVPQQQQQEADMHYSYYGYRG